MCLACAGPGVPGGARRFPERARMRMARRAPCERMHVPACSRMYPRMSSCVAAHPLLGHLSSSLLCVAAPLFSSPPPLPSSATVVAAASSSTPPSPSAHAHWFGPATRGGRGEGGEDEDKEVQGVEIDAEKAEGEIEVQDELVPSPHCPLPASTLASPSASPDADVPPDTSHVPSATMDSPRGPL